MRDRIHTAVIAVLSIVSFSMLASFGSDNTPQSRADIAGIWLRR